MAGTVSKSYDVEKTLEAIRDVLETPNMTEVSISFHASLDEVPELHYRVERNIMPF